MHISFLFMDGDAGGLLVIAVRPLNATVVLSLELFQHLSFGGSVNNILGRTSLRVCKKDTLSVAQEYDAHAD